MSRKVRFILVGSICGMLFMLTTNKVNPYAAENNKVEMNTEVVEADYDFYFNGSGGDVTSEEFVYEGGVGSNIYGLVRATTTGMSTSSSGVNLIKKYESCRLKAYDDLQPSVTLTKDTVIKGRLTIGYGHTGSVDGKAIAWNTQITQAKADELLKGDLSYFENSVNSFASNNNIKLKQCQFDALVSFSYNVGTKWMSGTSTLKKYLTNGISNYSDDEIVNAFSMWNKSGGSILTGLTRRRREEAAFFLNNSAAANYKKGKYITGTTLNVREGPGTKYNQVSKNGKKLVLDPEKTITITKIEGYWGKYSDGWVLLDYCSFVAGSGTDSVGSSGSDSDVSTYSTGAYTIAVPSLNVRSGAGVKYSPVGIVNSGDCVYVSDVSGGWGKIPKGWISLSYCKKYTVNKPTLKSVSVSSTGPIIKWSKVSVADGYYVYKKIESGSWTKIKKITSNTKLSYKDTNVVNGQKVQYKVYAYKNISGSAVKSKSSASKTWYHVSRTSITSLSSSSSGAFNVKWKQNSKATRYLIKYSLNSDFSSAGSVYVNAFSLNKTVTKLKSKKTYYVRIKTYIDVGNTSYVSAWSNKKKITVK